MTDNKPTSTPDDGNRSNTDKNIDGGSRSKDHKAKPKNKQQANKHNRRAENKEKIVETVYCHECGSEIRRAAEICPECGVRQQHSEANQRGPASQSEQKNPGLAAVLSFFLAGAGQIYNGEIGKGIALAISEVIVVVIIVMTIWILIGFFFIPIWFVLLGYAVWDAYDKAQKINRGEYHV